MGRLLHRSIETKASTATMITTVEEDDELFTKSRASSRGGSTGVGSQRSQSVELSSRGEESRSPSIEGGKATQLLQEIAEETGMSQWFGIKETQFYDPGQEKKANHDPRRSPDSIKTGSMFDSVQQSSHQQLPPPPNYTELYGKEGNGASPVTTDRKQTDKPVQALSKGRVPIKSSLKTSSSAAKNKQSAADSGKHTQQKQAKTATSMSRPSPYGKPQSGRATETGRANGSSNKGRLFSKKSDKVKPVHSQHLPQQQALSGSTMESSGNHVCIVEEELEPNELSFI